MEIKGKCQFYCRPENYKELYNLRHAQLRNVIERIFGVLKKRFPILVVPKENFSIETQRNIVIALCGLHNFIRAHDKGDDYIQNAFIPDIEAVQEEVQRDNPDRADVGEWRDNIALQMMNDYQVELERRHL